MSTHGQVYRWHGAGGPAFADRVRIMRVLGELGARMPLVRAWALRAIRAAGLASARDRRATADAILRYAHRTMVWAKELDEQFVRPDRTIEMAGGDCDDLAMLLFAALRSVGVPPAEVEFRYLRDGETWMHAWAYVYLPALRRWYHLEGSVAGYPPGLSPLPLVRRLRHAVT